MSERVTVIIPYFNQGRYLERAVLSALAAYRGPIEILIIDDGSTELGAESYLRKVKSLSSCIRIIQKPNGGLSSARNIGLDKATGDYIQFLDCDDILVSGKIDHQVGHIKAAKIDASICGYAMCDDLQEDITVESYDVIGSFDLTLSSFLYHWERGFIIPIHCGLFLRTSIDTFRFDESVYGKEDWIFWCQLIGQGAQLSYLPTVGAVYRQHSGGMTKARLDQMGQSWLVAANKIAASVPGADSGFLDAARSWYTSHYETQNPRRSDPVAVMTNDEKAIHGDTRESDKFRVAKENFSTRAIHRSPFFSIIIPVFNHYEYFIQCLCSLFQQNTIDFEIIIVDDKSSDSRIKLLLDDIDGMASGLKIVRNTTNLGISLSQNCAVDAAAGEFLVFVDCDDMLVTNALEQVQAVLMENPDVDYLFTDRFDIDEHGKRIREAKYGGYPTILPGGPIHDDLLDGMVASHLKVIKRSVYEAVGGCNPDFDGAQDWDLALKVLMQGGKFHYLSMPLYLHRIHQKSVTTSDSPRQFRLTNIIRRNYLLNITGREIGVFGGEYPLPKEIENKLLFFDQDILIMLSSQLPVSGSDLRHACSKYRGCILFEDVKISPPQLAFLREWNSYFDLILLDRFDTYVGLIGYLWDQRACCFRHDFSAEFLNSLKLTSPHSN